MGGPTESRLIRRTNAARAGLAITPDSPSRSRVGVGGKSGPRAITVIDGMELSVQGRRLNAGTDGFHAALSSPATFVPPCNL
jgi:hypothetical protein